MKRICSLMLVLCLLVSLPIPTVLAEECGHLYVDGVCEKCSEPCSHTASFSSQSAEDESILSFDEKSHTIKRNIHNVTVCSACGTVLEDLAGEEEVLVQDHSFFDGHCDVCGFEGTCPHDKVHSYIHYHADEVTVTERTADSHTLEGLLTEDIVCDLCTATLSSATDHSALTEAHLYFGGVCTVCGFDSASCPHEDIVCEHWPANGRYYIASCDETSHTMMCNREDHSVCSNCGVTVEVTNIGYGPLVQAHEFDGDVCTVCGYAQNASSDHATDDAADLATGDAADPAPAQSACTHERTGVYGYYMDDSFVVVSIDESGHTVQGARHEILQCLDCGWKVSDTVVDPEYEEHLLHKFSYEEQKCEVCGYSCMHDYTYFSHESTEINYDNLLSRDQNTHTFSAAVHRYTRCLVCDKQISDEIIDPYCEVTDDHDFNYKGTCRDCGYACPHERVESSDIEETSFTVVSFDENGHTFRRALHRVTECTVCGKTLTDEIIDSDHEVTLTHSFYHGKCGLCDYPCPHAHTRLIESTENEILVAKDANGHTIKSELHRITRCEDCDFNLSDEIIDPEYETHETHIFSDGMCGRCHYPCAHARTFSASTEYGDYWDHFHYTVVSTDENFHTLKGPFKKTERCAFCGMDLSYEIIDDYAIVEEHDFFEGECWICGQKNACQHLHTSPLICYYKYEGYDASSDYEVIGKSGSTHILEGRFLSEVWCDDCGENLPDVYLTKRITDYHEYDREGICIVCGYKSTCTHEHVQKEVSCVDDPSGEAINVDHISSFDETTHTRSGMLVYRYFCPDCGDSREDWGDYGDLTEPHTFSRNGICISCGYQNTCIHEHAETVRRITSASFDFVSADSAGHTFSGLLSDETTCLDCGQLLRREDVGTGELTSAHDYLNGICMTCGYEQPTGERPSFSVNLEGVVFGEKTSGTGLIHLTQDPNSVSLPDTIYVYLRWTFKDSHDEDWVFDDVRPVTDMGSFDANGIKGAVGSSLCQFLVIVTDDPDADTKMLNQINRYGFIAK